ncbi:SDR family oxidoreductase [Candidatus Pelagibacter sp.]|nr:SDR family oxidoreductase [Candidatus Pelagibacter sp.]
MKIYIIGITGMLGGKLFIEFLKNKNFKVRGSCRLSTKQIDKYEKFIDLNCDINNLELLKKKLLKYKPDLIINCAGVVKQKIGKDFDEKNTFYINSIFPHELYKISSKIKSRLIHFSTDCVFDGKKGNYNENFLPNSTDLYGLSKILGEVSYKNSLTLRTSIIGHEFNNRFGLLEWFLSQKNKCNGFSECYFSGFPTIEIYLILLKIIKNKKLSGIYHLSSQRISKFHLLTLISKIYKFKISIKKNIDIKIDRSLNSNKIKKIIDYKSPSWSKLIKNMYINYRINL